MAIEKLIVSNKVIVLVKSRFVSQNILRDKNTTA